MFRSGDVRPWVAHSATVAVSLAVFIGFGIYSRESMTGPSAAFANEIFTGCRWAAITCAVVAGPVTGALAQTSLERVLGTIIGGTCGFLVCFIATPVSNAWEWTVYAAMAGAFGWAAVYMGHRLSLNYSFKLAIITFLLVFAGADDLEEAKTIALTRTLGIIAGVTMTLILSVSILPVSAHHQHDEALNKALRSLLSLQALCWVPLTHTHEFHGPSFLSPTPTTHHAGWHGPHQHGRNACPNPQLDADSDDPRGDSGTGPLMSPRSPRISPHASPARSCQLPLPQEDSQEGSMCGAPLVSSCPPSGAAGGYGAGNGSVGAAQGLNGRQSLAQNILTRSESTSASASPFMSPPGALQNMRGSGGGGALVGNKPWVHDVMRSSSSDGGASGGLVKRSEFASVNWEVQNLKINDEGDIRSAEDIVVEVYSALNSAEASLAVSEREIYAGRIFGRPFYIPRFVASLVCLGGQRSVPIKQAKAACAAARGAARVLLALHSLLKEGTDSVVKEVLHERYPGALMPDVVKFSGFAIQDCIEAFNRGAPVCGSSLELLRTTVATLISISGAHRSRIHHQYLTYRSLAHDLRARLYSRSAGGHSLASSRRCSVQIARTAGGMSAAGTHSASVRNPSLAQSSPGEAMPADQRSNGSGGVGLGGKFWRMISGRLSTSFGRGSSTTSGMLPRLAVDHDTEGMRQPLLQVLTDRSQGGRGNAGCGRASLSDRSTSSSRTPRVSSPFSSQQVQDPFTSPDSIRLSFAVHRDEPLPPRQGVHSMDAERADEEQVLRQLSGGLTTNPSQVPQSGPLALHEDAHARQAGVQKTYHSLGLAPHGAMQGARRAEADTSGNNTHNRSPTASCLHDLQPTGCAPHLASLPEQVSDVCVQNGACANACSDKHRLTEQCMTPDPPQQSVSSADPRTPQSGVRNTPQRIEDAPSFTLSSVAFPSHQQSFADSFIEGEASAAMVLNNHEDSQTRLDDTPCTAPTLPRSTSMPSGKLSPCSTVPRTHASGVSITRSPEGGLRVPEAPPRAETCTPTDLITLVPPCEPEAERGAAQRSYLMPQGSGRPAVMPRTLSAGAAPKTPAPGTASGQYCAAASGDLGEAQRLLARSGTQPMLLFPDTPEGYYAEITYYTFQFHLEEIVDATEQLQCTLCELITAMPRNAMHQPHGYRLDASRM